MDEENTNIAVCNAFLNRVLKTAEELEHKEMFRRAWNLREKITQLGARDAAKEVNEFNAWIYNEVGSGIGI